MANWKLGTGENYAGLSGFTWNEDEHPSNFQMTIVRKQDQTDYDLKEHNIIHDKGIKQVTITFDGKLRNDSDMNTLQTQASKGRYFINDGEEEVDMYFEQKFFPGETFFYFVRNSQVQKLREGQRPLLRNYNISLDLTDPFRYANTPTERTASGGSGTTSSQDMSGNYVQLPEFEFTITSGTVTRLVIECNKGGTITAPLPSLTAGKVVVDQRLGILFIFDGSGNLLSSRNSFGGRIALRESDTGVTFSFTATGGSGTFKAIHRERNI